MGFLEERTQDLSPERLGHWPETIPGGRLASAGHGHSSEHGSTGEMCVVQSGGSTEDEERGDEKLPGGQGQGGQSLIGWANANPGNGKGGRTFSFHSSIGGRT